MAKVLVFRLAVIIILALCTLPICDARPGSRYQRSSDAAQNQPIGGGVVPPPGKMVCENCVVDIDVDGREYYSNCIVSARCPLGLVDKMKEIKNGKADVVGEYKEVTAVDNKAHYTVIGVPARHLDGNFDMGSGEGDKVLSLCMKCDMKVYDNGITLWHCKEENCPHVFKDNFSWNPFKTIVTMVPSETCVFEGMGGKTNIFYCYYDI